jgi:hypothetical protein
VEWMPELPMPGELALNYFERVISPLFEHATFATSWKRNPVNPFWYDSSSSSLRTGHDTKGLLITIDQTGVNYPIKNEWFPENPVGDEPAPRYYDRVISPIFQNGICLECERGKYHFWIPADGNPPLRSDGKLRSVVVNIEPRHVPETEKQWLDDWKSEKNKSQERRVINESRPEIKRGDG